MVSSREFQYNKKKGGKKGRERINVGKDKDLTTIYIDLNSNEVVTHVYLS